MKKKQEQRIVESFDEWDKINRETSSPVLMNNGLFKSYYLGNITNVDEELTIGYSIGNIDDEFYVSPNMEDWGDIKFNGVIKDRENIFNILKATINVKGEIINPKMIPKLEKELDNLESSSDLFGGETYNGWDYDNISDYHSITRNMSIVLTAGYVIVKSDTYLNWKRKNELSESIKYQQDPEYKKIIQLSKYVSKLLRVELELYNDEEMKNPENFDKTEDDKGILFLVKDDNSLEYFEDYPLLLHLDVSGNFQFWNDSNPLITKLHTEQDSRSMIQSLVEYPLSITLLTRDVYLDMLNKYREEWE